MENPLKTSDMPPLTLEVTKKLRGMERDLQSDLGSCCNNYDLTDREAAFEYVRTYAVKFYECFYSFYSQILDPRYRPHWRPASETFAYQRVLKCIKNNSATRSAFYFDNDRGARIRRTISDYADRHSIPEKIATLQSPNRSSVFVPVLTSPRKRISRSIESKKAAQRLEAYIEDKGITQTDFSVAVNVDPKTLYRFRRSGKVAKSVAKRIAEEMSITLDQFLA